jgi:penicillin-binding protein 1C
VTVGVWVGNFDRQPLVGSSGVTGAGPLFHAVMLAAQRHVRGDEQEGAPIVDRPDDLVEQTVCALSGMRAGDACPIRVREWLPKTFSPLPCAWHHDSEEGLLTLWPDQYRSWARGRGLLDEEDGPAERRAGGVRSRDRRVAPVHLEITSPPPGSTYLIDPTLRSEFQTLPLRASAGVGELVWEVDGRAVGRGAADQSLAWPLARGQHVVRARDGKGRVAESAILVK